MTLAMHQLSPVAHWPVVLGGVRTLNGAALLATCCPLHPAHGLSCGRGVEALRLAILDGPHALYTVGARLEARGMFSLLQPGLTRASLHADRLGQSLGTRLAAPLNRVCGAIALNALAVYAVPPPGAIQEPTRIPLSGPWEGGPRPVQGLVPPRPADGPSQDGHDDLQQVLLRLGVRRDGLPLRLGVREGNTSDSPDTPGAIEECLALGLEGGRGIGADRKASCTRPLGWCLEQRVGRIPVVPRPCAGRQA